MKNFVYLVSVLFLTTLVTSKTWAAASGWDDHSTHVALFQLLNVSILLGACFYFLKDAVVVHFKSRWLAYQQSAEIAQKELLEAQKSFNEAQAALTKVENTWSDVLSRVEAEAVEERKKSILASEEMIAKMLKDSRKGLEQEFIKLQSEIYSDIVAKVKLDVTQQMRTKLTSEDHKKLQKDFNQSVQGV